MAVVWWIDIKIGLSEWLWNALKDAFLKDKLQKEWDKERAELREKWKAEKEAK